MNEKIPQKMYDAFWEEDRKDGPSRMGAALLWLADNVSDDMVHHLIGELFKHRPPAFKFEYTAEQARAAISAALRAAGDGR